MYFCVDGYNRWYVCLCNFREWYVIRFQTESTQVGKVGWESHSFPGNLPPRKRLSRQLHSAICLHLSCPVQGNNQDFKLSRLPPGCHLILGPGVQTRKAIRSCSNALQWFIACWSCAPECKAKVVSFSTLLLLCFFSEIIFKNGGRGAAPFSKGEHKILDKWAKVLELPGSVWSP